MQVRQLISSGAAWESQVGYSRALRCGPLVEVAGTTATEGSQVCFPGEAGPQARMIFEKIARALAEAGASLSDVVRTRIYLTHLEDWEAVGKEHQAVFGEIRPAATLVIVTGLIHPDLRVEIEATAYLPSA
jgi:enamine deaminase RidA (YjgF/YER057c/UK114 family)